MPLKEDEQLPADDSDVDCDEIPESVLARFSQSQEHLDQSGTVNKVPNQTGTPSTTAAIPRTKRIGPRFANKTTKSQNAEDDDDDDEEEDDDTECITFTTAIDQMTLSPSKVCIIFFNQKLFICYNVSYLISQTELKRLKSTPKASPAKESIYQALIEVKDVLDNLVIQDTPTATTVPIKSEAVTTATVTITTNQSTTISPTSTTPTIIHATPKQQQST